MEEATQTRGAQQEENSGMKRKHVEDEEEKMSPSKKQVDLGSDSTFKTIY